MFGYHVEFNSISFLFIYHWLFLMITKKYIEKAIAIKELIPVKVDTYEDLLYNGKNKRLL